MRRINLKSRTALLTIVLLGLLTACRKESGIDDWYLMAADPQRQEAVSISPFGKDHAKCDEFAAKFPKQLGTRCVSGQELDVLRQTRHWRCVQGVCASTTNS